MNRQHIHGLVDSLLDLKEELLPALPADARRHFRNARREGLLGIRSLVDEALARLDPEGEEAVGDEPRSIPVEG